MLNEKGKILYIGKAKHLQKRVSSYFNRATDTKTQSLVSQIARIEWTVTANELEALILEHNLIKTHKPRYNVLLKDDKSYPYIHISTHQTFPRMEIVRGAKRPEGEYFGPYPNGYAAKQSLLLLQKLFKIRSCRDSFFAHRSRPCLQYQIKRCTAPCVDYIEAEAYRQDVAHAVAFLKGDSQEVITALIAKMDRASADLRYEEAALYRDQIQLLQQLVQRQYVNRGYGFADVCVVAARADQACVTQLFIRQGQVLGHNNYFFKRSDWQTTGELLAEFVGQYYVARQKHEIPGELVVNEELADKTLLEKAIQEQTGKPIRLLHRVKQDKKQWILLAEANAQSALTAHLASQSTAARRVEALSEWLKLPALERMECFDVSHTQGDCTVASAVVFNQDGPLNQDYRRYNIKGITPGDDYAALSQALLRHYQRRKSEEAVLPDLILIDGGKGQLRRAQEAMEELQLTDILLMGVSKGPARKPGEEQLWLVERSEGGGEIKGPLRLPPDSPALHLIQHIRDESHRFAIVGHRRQRAKRSKESVLEDIPGIGPKKRQALLKHFGGLQGILEARVEALAEVPGMSKALAQALYDSIHQP
jgi:excinuclease ABC subunit C